MPDSRSFSVYDNRHKPFAKYDYLNILPPRSFLEGFLKICEFARLNKIKLNTEFKNSEERAFLALKTGRYT